MNREIADGHDEVLAEAAGITAGSWYAWPSTRVGYELIAAGMLIMVDATMVSRWTLTSWSCGRASALAGDEVPQKANADACRSLEQVAILHPKFSCPPTECKHRQTHCGCHVRTERNQRSQDPGRIRVLPPQLGRRNSTAGPPTTRNPRRSIRDLQSCFTCSAAKDPERPQKAPRANHQSSNGSDTTEDTSWSGQRDRRAWNGESPLPFVW